MIEATRRLRRYRDIVGVPAAARIPARLVPDDASSRGLYERSLVTIQRLARFDFELGRRRTAPVGLSVAIPGARGGAAAERGDRPRARRRPAHRRPRATQLRAEIERAAAASLANQRFVEKAPAGGRRSRSARSSRASSASSPSSSARRTADSTLHLRAGRALPALARAVRHALRARAHAPADDGARLAAGAVRVRCRSSARTASPRRRA